MTRKTAYSGIALICFGILGGCAKPELTARVDGIVRRHADTYPSGSGGAADLVRSNQMVSGRKYGDPAKTDWKSDIHWQLTGHRGKSDVYRFKCTFAASNGSPVSHTREVEYDGTESVIVFQDKWQTIAIEQGSIPLPKNNQAGVPGDG